ncbi:MAG: hypothetical protein PHU14_07860 [Methylovulum sp.]|nr:hypothetical protein [Methylovulum sp.]
MLEICDGCACSEGELHESFCTQEICPFCGALLASCGCMPKVLKLTPEEQHAVDAYIDDEIEPLKSINERWAQALDEKGRVPFHAVKVEAESV